MADAAHIWTDEEIGKLEHKIQDIFAQAAREMQAKNKKALVDYTKQNAEWKKKLKEKPELKGMYNAWLKETAAKSSVMNATTIRLLHDAMHAEEKAADLINDALPTVFAGNVNYQMYEIETGAGIETSFALYDEDTVRVLVKQTPDLLPSVNIDSAKSMYWNSQKITSAVTQGILQGESIPDIAKRIGQVTMMDASAAIRAARTACTGAENAGREESYKRAQRMGIKLKQVWRATLDGRTRDSHRLLDGEVQNIGDKFSNGCRYPGDPRGIAAEVMNCFIADTNIAVNCDINRSYKHDYSGELITIKTSSGVNFTCTPNHPILTADGWVPVKTLNNGDNLLIASIGNDASPKINPNIDHAFPSINTIHEFFNKFGSKRTCSLGVNFHGDIPTSDVEVITKKGFLRDDGISGRFNSIGKFLLIHADFSVLRNCHFLSGLRRINITPFSIMGCLRDVLTFFWCHMRHAVIHGFRAITRRNPVIFQTQANDMSSNMKFFSDRFNGPSCKVFFDNVINIDITTVSHIPVFNLQTENGYYFVNSIISENNNTYNGNFAIAHNCRCTLVSEIDGVDYSDEVRPSAYLEEHGLTYEEWKAGKDKQKQQNVEPEPEPANTVVDGKDIIGTWHRRSDQYDFEIEDVIAAQGFDGKPHVVSAKEFDKAVKAANNGEGLIMQRVYSAQNKEILDSYRDDLYHGKWFIDCSVNGSTYGQGMYATPNYEGVLSDGIKESMNFYAKFNASRGSTEHYIETMTLTRDAKIVNYLELEPKYNAYREAIKQKAQESARNIREEAEEQFLIDLIKSADIPADKIEDGLYFLKANTGRGESDWGKMSAAASSLGEEGRNKIFALNNPKNFAKEHDFVEEYVNSHSGSYVIQDIGSYAALQGYDAIRSDYGIGGGEIVILNRTKCIIKEP